MMSDDYDGKMVFIYINGQAEDYSKGCSAALNIECQYHSAVYINID